jgi:hypothetical protein
MKAMIAAVLLMVGATSAQAWGAREQGMLAGIAGTLLFQHVTRAPTQPQVTVGGTVHGPNGTVYGQVQTQPRYSQSGPVIIEQPRMYIPAPPRCQVVPVYDYYGRYVAQQTLCNW